MRQIPVLEPRVAVLRRRALRRAWLLLALGLLIPFVALAAAVQGWALREHTRQGWLLVMLGVGVFAVRLAYWRLG